VLDEIEGARRKWSRIAWRLMEQRTEGKKCCSQCKELRSLEEFYNHYKRPRAECKYCSNARRQRWRNENWERDRDTWRRYQARKRERDGAA